MNTAGLYSEFGSTLEVQNVKINMHTAGL